MCKRFYNATLLRIVLFSAINLILLISIYLYLVAMLESNNTIISLNYGMPAFHEVAHSFPSHVPILCSALC